MFTVQGEGRGHMTQAISMSQILRKAGHEMVAVLAGRPNGKSWPAFFESAFPVPVTPIQSPIFTLKNGKSVDVPGTLAVFARGLGDYSRSLHAIHETINDTKPDLIINFLEPLMGFYNFTHRHLPPTISLGHQFMMEHPEFVRLRGYVTQQAAMRRFVGMAGARSIRTALSFYEATDYPNKQLFVSPPLLRQQLFQLEPDPNGKFILAYMVNEGYAEEIRHWHQAHPKVPIHCFRNQPEAPKEERVDDTLTFHQLDGEKFLKMMAACRAVACTAGFESVSEAAYLGKPILVVPVENHVEQMGNALDAEKAGLAIWDRHFDLARLLDFTSGTATRRFRDWVDRAEAVFLSIVSYAAAEAPVKVRARVPIGHV